MLTDNRSDGSTSRIARDDETSRIDAKLDGAFRDPSRGEGRVIDASRKRVLGREAIANRDHATSARVGEQATQSIVRPDVAEDSRASVEIHDARERLTFCIVRRVDPNRDLAVGTEGRSILHRADGDATRVGDSSETSHRSPERVGVERRLFSLSPRGEHVQESLGVAIDWHRDVRTKAPSSRRDEDDASLVYSQR